MKLIRFLQWQWCKWRATRILNRTKRQYPLCEDAKAIDVSVGGGSSETSSAFSRKGEEKKTESFGMPSYLGDLIDKQNQDLTTGNVDPHRSFLDLLLSRDQQAFPTFSQFSQLSGDQLANYPWYSNLTSLAQRDPFSSAYEASTTDAFIQRLNDSLGRLDGATVRGGTNHSALLKGQATSDAMRQRGEDLARQRGVDSGITLGSAGLLNQLQQIISGQKLGATGALQGGNNAYIQQALEAGNQRTQRGAVATGGLAQGARLRGEHNEAITSDMSGQGTQNSSNFNWGTGASLCCFIFLEALNGEMPAYVRRGRDKHQTPEGVRGYKWMASWLVPKMQRNRLVRWLVNYSIVKPIMAYGAWLYDEKTEPGYRCGWCFAPVLYGWLGVWNVIGRTYAK